MRWIATSGRDFLSINSHNSSAVSEVGRAERDFLRSRKRARRSRSTSQDAAGALPARETV